MSAKRTVGRNAIWNTAGLFVDVATAFLLTPILIARLGDSFYGLWIVFGSLTGYFGLLDLGIRSSVGRYIAYHSSRESAQGVNEIFNTALVALAVLGLTAFALVVGCIPLFLRLFEVPADGSEQAVTALYLVGGTIAVTLVGKVFDATLWGYQRFDLLNAIDIPVIGLRTGLVFLLVEPAHGLVALAAITLGTTVVTGVAKAAAALGHDPGLRLSSRYLSKGAFRSILGYGGWTLLGTVARITRAQISSLLIGSLAGLALVTPYSIAARLVSLVGSVLSSVTGVLTPFATALHAKDDTRRQATLLLQGGRYACVLALFLTCPLILLGELFIVLWTGPQYGYVVTTLVVLALGELLPATQVVTNGVIAAKAKHKALAYAGVVEAGLVAGLTSLLLGPFGLVGAAVGVAVPGAVCRGLVPLVVGCRLVGVPVRRYAWDALLVPALYAAGPAAALAAAVALRPPGTWVDFFGYAVGYSLAYAAVVGRTVARRARPMPAPDGAVGGNPGTVPGAAGPA